MHDYLPLFPLDVVLFPEMLLPLHIFEERYKEMIGECLQGKSVFGVLYAHGDRVERIGCTAEISQVVRRYPDGRMDLVAVGKKRFQVSFFDSQRAYLQADFEWLPDTDAEGEPSEERARRTLELFGKVCKLTGQDPEDPSREFSRQGLAFSLASRLQLTNEIRQCILEALSEDSRLELLAEHLSELVPILTSRHKLARQAGSNGHLRHE